MCGIAGYALTNNTTNESCALAVRMSRALRHRGPDDEGFVFAAPGLAAFRSGESAADIDLPALPDAHPHTVALVHRRFSIFDLSRLGHQPFVSADNRFSVTYNGEIYNHEELRSELEALGYRFRSRSDTEVLLYAFQAWGESCFERFIGFWAVAIWDQNRGRVLLARDRLGKAPLYVMQRPEGWYFASEIKALRLVGDQTPTVSESAVRDFILHGWRDVGDSTFFEDIRSFPRASYAWLDSAPLSPTTFWRFPEERLSERQLPVDQAAAGLREILTSAVQLRLRADVPIAFELSGGMDSSSLMAIAAPFRDSLQAFTVSYPGESDVNEIGYARAVAQSLGDKVKHTELTPKNDRFFDVADEFVAHMDEPFHAPNLLTNRDMWQSMADTGTRVSINGAAGDELFAGYSATFLAPMVRHYLSVGNFGQASELLFRPKDRPTASYPHHIALTLGRTIATPTLRNWYRKSSGMATEALKVRPETPTRGPRGQIEGLIQDCMSDWMMNYWLRSGNTNFMAVPMEVRFPFLDHRVVEYSMRLPIGYLVRDGWMKWILRKAVDDLLPEEVTWRRQKLGFPFPWTTWARENRQRFFAIVKGLDCPYLVLPELEREYDGLAVRNPALLWRLMSVALWWKRCILNEALVG